MKNELGFEYDPEVINVTLPEPNRERALFRVVRLFPEFVWDTTSLEGNPFTFPEVKTLLEGITIGGHRLEDESQVINQSKSWKRLVDMVRNNEFELSKACLSELNGIVAREEALQWGVFRDGQVTIAGTKFVPPAHTELDAIFERGTDYIGRIASPLERGMAFCLFGALNQFFYDGNKRTSRLMMNGILLKDGFDAISVPAARRLEYNEKMVRFYDSLDGTEMISFLIKCSTFDLPEPSKGCIRPA